MQRVAALLGDADLEMLATNDGLWDHVKSAEHVGVEDVYDATVMECTSSWPNRVPVHTSIEQDADMVILLHREDVYEGESTRPGRPTRS